MSTAFSANYISQTPINQNGTNGRLASISSAIPYAQLASSSGASSSIQNVGAQVHSNPLASLKKAINSKRTVEELEVMRETAERWIHYILGRDGFTDSASH